VNSERYHDAIKNLVRPKLNDKDLDDTWFQQDGATCHTVNETIALLHSKFPGRVISQRGDTTIAHQDQRFNFVRPFSSGVKRKIFANNTKTIPEVQDDIRRVVVGMEPRLCERSMENFERERKRKRESDIPQEEPPFG